MKTKQPIDEKVNENLKDRQKILDEVLYQRERQIVLHKYSSEDDDKLDPGSLTVLANQYMECGVRDANRHQMIQAIALLVAEVEKFDRNPWRPM